MSQTCDIVRSCTRRPFLEVCPLVRAKPEDVADAQRGRSTRFTALRGLPDPSLLVDLERTMTVEEAVVAEWPRTQGCLTDEDARAFARVLARRRARATFPDAFVTMVKPMQEQLIKRHGKQSPEGRALRALREIRIQADPSWTAPAPSSRRCWG